MNRQQLGERAIDLVLKLNVEMCIDGLGKLDFEALRALAKEIESEIGRNCRVMCWTEVEKRDPYSPRPQLILTYWWYLYDGRIDFTRDEVGPIFSEAQRGSHCAVVDRARSLGPRGRSHRRRINRVALANFIESQASKSEAARKIRQGIYDVLEEEGDDG